MTEPEPATDGDDAARSRSRGGHIGLVAAVSIGVGGMVGAGIFSILGVVAEVSGPALPLSFAVGGVVALLAGYSYVHLGARFPSVGGAVQFLVQGFGDGVLSGALNIFQYLAYVIAIALYANGFAGYAMTFLPQRFRDVDVAQTACAIGVVVVFTVVNLLGAAIMGRAESAIVVAKVGILVVFVAGGIGYVEPSRLALGSWADHGIDVLVAAGVLFIGYEGFGLIANAAGNMENPRRELPRAIYLAIGIVIAIYVSVAVTVIGTVSISQMAAAKDYALAYAAEPFLGSFGFRLVAVAALLSTASAVNATLFGAANVSYQIAKDGELPADFTRRIWDRNPEGLLITAGLVIVFISLFSLGPIAMMGSAAFLIVYTAVNAAHLRVAAETGARRWLIWASIVTLAAIFAVLVVYIARNQPAALLALAITLVVSFLAEWAYRRRSGRRLTLVTRR